MIGDADRDAADQIQDDDHQRRDRIALDEFSGAVHRAVEIRFLLNERAFATRAFRVERAGVHVGVDRHLLARHRIEREARRDFGDALRARGDHDELNRDQDCEHDQPDDEVAAHDEPSERRNRARRRRPRRDLG